MCFFELGQNNTTAILLGTFLDYFFILVNTGYFHSMIIQEAKILLGRDTCIIETACLSLNLECPTVLQHTITIPVFITFLLSYLSPCAWCAALLMYLMQWPAVKLRSFGPAPSSILKLFQPFHLNFCLWPRINSDIISQIANMYLSLWGNSTGYLSFLLCLLSKITCHVFQQCLIISNYFSSFK